MPGNKYNSIQSPRMYRALRRRGYTKEQAARISNARTPGHTVKATQITGNLYRGEGGKFQAGPGGSAKPAARDELEKPTTDRPDRAAEHDQWQAEEDARRQAEDAQIAAEPNRTKRAALRRQVTLARQERGRERRAEERANREGDRQARDTERDAAKLATDQAREEREREKPKKGGGGGGGKAPKAKPTDDEKRAASLQKRAQTAQATATQVGLPDGASDTLRLARDQGGVTDPTLARLGLVGPDGFTTDQGRRALGALERGDTGGYHAALQDARSRMQREAAAQQRQAERDKPKEEEPPAPKRPTRRERLQARRRAKLIADNAAETEAYNTRRRRATKSAQSFAVFKDSRGQDRWVSISSTAYRDRDGEIVSRKALAQAVDRGDTSGQRGPLRFWHVPGLDLGDCDFQAVGHDGRILMESGTFRHPAYAEAIKERGANYGISIGFVHPPTQPDNAGVFDDIVIFERSLTPPGRASNPFTSITTKESRMLTTQKDAELAALLGGRDSAAYKVAISTMEHTDKTAKEQGATFKEVATPDLPLYELDGQPYTVKEGKLVALKAMPAIAEAKAPMPAPEMVEAGETEVDDGLGDELVDDGGPLLADADIQAIAQAVLAGITPLFDIQKQIGELKSALSGSMGAMPATKETAQPFGAGAVVGATGSAVIQQPQAAVAQPAVVEKAAEPSGLEAILKELTTLKTTVAQLKGELPIAATTRPSQSADTAIDAANPLLDGYKSVADNPAGVIEGFLNGFKRV